MFNDLDPQWSKPRPAPRFIVKIQVSLATNAARPQALMTTRDRTIRPYQCDVTDDLAWMMMGRPKAFFWATLDGGTLRFDGDAPWQAW